MDSTKRATKLYIGFYRHSSPFGILISAIFHLMRFEIINSEISTFSTFAGHYQFHGVFFKDKTRKKNHAPHARRTVFPHFLELALGFDLIKSITIPY
jgi:hypothetical protein